MADTTPTFAQDVLYILASENNNTGLTAKRARELTATILMQLGSTLSKLCRSGARFSDLYNPMVFTDVDDLIAALDLRRDMLNEPHHDWEPRTDGATWLALFERNLALIEQLDTVKRDLLALQQEYARVIGLGTEEEGEHGG